MRENPLQRLADEAPGVRRRKGTVHTPGEILQQPELWRDTAKRAAALAPRIRGILKGAEFLLFTGAGSSLHAAQLMEIEARSRGRTEVSSVSCTDLMLSPDAYLPRSAKGVLFSLSRSGESPESVEAARVVAEKFSHVSHVAITCNAKGKLARRVGSHRRGACLVLHEKSYDKGLGTTSSMTSTVIGGYALLSASDPDSFGGRVEALARNVEGTLRNSKNAEFHADASYERVVFLGTGPLEVAAREAAHKVMELTDGAVVTLARSPLEFRHGPIAFINRKTLVVVESSPDLHVRRYDHDVVEQLAAGRQAGNVISSVPGGVGKTRGLLAPEDAALSAIVWAQMFALFTSIKRGLSPDRPGSRGLVNPVVQGVTIHPRKP